MKETAAALETDRDALTKVMSGPHQAKPELCLSRLMQEPSSIPLAAVFKLLPLACAQHIAWVLQKCKQLLQRCQDEQAVFQDTLRRGQEETRAASAQSDTLTTELAEK